MNGLGACKHAPYLRIRTNAGRRLRPRTANQARLEKTLPEINAMAKGNDARGTATNINLRNMITPAKAQPSA